MSCYVCEKVIDGLGHVNDFGEYHPDPKVCAENLGLPAWIVDLLVVMRG